MHNVKAPDDEFIMDLYPIEYKNDNGLKLSRPVGAYSKQLSATYNFILCENSAKDRLRRVFINAGINLKGLYASGAIIAESLVSKDEKKDGVAIVDIGSGVTDIAVYYDNVLCHMTSLPIGGSAVNNDIHHFTTNLSAETVEKLKLKQGTAIVTSQPDKSVKIVKGSSTREISLYNLEKVMEARMTEIVDYVWREIRETGLRSRL
jgi:cell division protein FtsA